MSLPSTLPFCCHCFLSVNVGRGAALRDYFMFAFDAEIVHQQMKRIGVSEKGINVLTVYLRVPGSRMIIELQEVDRPLAADASNGAMCIFMDDVTQRFDDAILLGGTYEGSESVSGTFIYRLRDPCGFLWFLASTDMVPRALPMQDSYTHYVMFIRRPNVRPALFWYKDAFGAVHLHHNHGPIARHQTNFGICSRHLLRFGRPNRPLVLEIVETDEDPIISNTSREMITIYTENLPALMLKITKAGCATVMNEDPNFFQVRDPYGFHWKIQAVLGNLLM